MPYYGREWAITAGPCSFDELLLTLAKWVFFDEHLRFYCSKETDLKRPLKQIAKYCALIFVAPLAASEFIARRIAGRDVWLDMQTELLSLLPGKSGILVRNAYYRLVLRKCSLDCCISFGTIISKSSTEIGRGVYLGGRCLIGLASIGEDTMLADHVHVLSGRHQHGTAAQSVRFQDQAQAFTRVQIGRNTWIGSNAVIMADIGENCIIGAGSVVTKPITANCVAVGNPARVIRPTYPTGEPRSAEPPPGEFKS